MKTFNNIKIIRLLILVTTVFFFTTHVFSQEAEDIDYDYVNLFSQIKAETITLSDSAKGESDVIHDPAEWVSGTLPVMYIVTQDSTPITSRDHYLSGYYWVDNMGLEGYESIGSADNPLSLQIKGRGNTSWTQVHKKPYRIKLDKKAALLGLKKNKHFCLMAYVGGSLMFLEEMASEFGRRLGLDWSPEIRPMELVLNGDYIGIYCVVEKIRVDKDRVNIVEQADFETDPELVTGGWLVEIDNTNENSDKQIRLTDRTDGTPLRFTWHSPDSLSNVQREYLTNLVTTIDSLIYVEDKSNNAWEQYIDAEALARFYVVCEMMDNVESFSGSCFWHKNIGNDEKIIFGPVWDQGSGYGHWRQSYKGFIYEDTPAYSHQHWIGEIAKFPHFQQLVRQIWNEIKENDLYNIDEFFDQIYGAIAGAAYNNYLRWIDYNYGINDVENRKAKLKRHVGMRMAWLDEQWSQPWYIMGDTNIDGVVNNADISTIALKIMGKTPERFNELASDINGDGVINVLDITGIIDIINEAEETPDPDNEE